MTERVRELETQRERETQSLNHLSIHRWVCSAIHASQQQTCPIGFRSLKIPPPPCAVLLVFVQIQSLTVKVCSHDEKDHVDSDDGPNTGSKDSAYKLKRCDVKQFSK